MTKPARSDLAHLLPGEEHLASALGTRQDVRDVLQRLLMLQTVLRRPADVVTMPRVAEELRDCVAVLVLVEHEVQAQAEDQEGPWKLFQWLAVARAWIDAAAIAHDYATHQTTLANEANAALDSAVIYVTEAALAYLRIETGAPLSANVIVMPKGRAHGRLLNLPDDVPDEHTPL